MPKTKARKGDLCAYQHTLTITPVRGSSRSTTTWRLGLVVQASREGEVRTLRELGYSSATTKRADVGQVLIVSAKALADLDGLTTAYKEHYGSFTSAVQVADFVRPFTIQPDIATAPELAE